MSTNVHIYANRQVRFNTPNGERTDTQSNRFACWQTPTTDSYRIQDSGDPILAYRKWVENRANTEIAAGHLRELDEWTARMEAAGYTIELEVW